MPRACMQGYFVKVALLREVFADPAVSENFDWIWWLDADANIVDADFVFPWPEYGHKDIVLWGNEESVVHPHPEKGAGASAIPPTLPVA
jgi:hypothetical protein